MAKASSDTDCSASHCRQLGHKVAKYRANCFPLCHKQVNWLQSQVDFASPLNVGGELTQSALGAIPSLLCSGDNGAVDPLQNQAHAMGVLPLMHFPRVAILPKQPLLHLIRLLLLEKRKSCDQVLAKCTHKQASHHRRTTYNSHHNNGVESNNSVCSSPCTIRQYHMWVMLDVGGHTASPPCATVQSVTSCTANTAVPM